MRCPYCGNTEDRVVDSRESKEGDVIRRRRECAQCERRFTSYEKIEHQPFHVVKRDQRQISAQQLEEVADSIERALHESGERELSSQDLGFLVMERLRELDTVAYVRFASVYRRFEDVEAFVRELHHLSESTAETGKKP
jgi:transcriptional repressor NrdR